MKRRIRMILAVCVTVIAALVLGPAALAQSSFQIKAEEESESFNKNLALAGYNKSFVTKELEFQWGLEESLIFEKVSSESEYYGGSTNWSNCTFEGTAYPAESDDQGWRTVWKIEYVGTVNYVSSTGYSFTGPWSGYFYAVDITNPGTVDSLLGSGACVSWNYVSALIEVE